jgi:LysM repeat protein
VEQGDVEQAPTTKGRDEGQETVKLFDLAAEDKAMTRFHRAIVAVCITVATGATGLVDAAHADAPSPAAPAAGAQTYTVQAGDYLSGIAAKLGVKLSALLATNKLTVTSLIYPGMQLVVPEGGMLPAPAAPAAPAQPAPAAVYTVQAGDSLSGIAGKMGVKVSALLATNKLSLTSVIHPGTQLSVPAGGTLPAATPAPAPAPAPAAQPVAALVYVVRSGDYLLGIAPALGVKVADLLSLNKLTLNSLIYPGMQLTVPAGGSLPTLAPIDNATPLAANPDGRVAKVLAFAQAQLGEPYKFNAAGPDSWDCSGLTLAAYAEIGISLPHYSGAQSKLGTAVDWTTEAIRPGDLIFLESAPGSGNINHVGIAISATQWIHAPRTGDVVRIGSIPTNRRVAVRRFVPAV